MSDEESKTPLRLADATVDGEVVLSRAEEAYQRKLSGASLTEIRDEMGFPNERDVSECIKGRMKYEAQFLEEDQRETILQLELARLDKQYQALWPSAMYGDIRANLALLAISDRRMKWSGMDVPDAMKGQHTVLVVGGDESTYLERLKSMVEDDG